MTAMDVGRLNIHNKRNDDQPAPTRVSNPAPPTSKIRKNCECISERSIAPLQVPATHAPSVPTASVPASSVSAPLILAPPAEKPFPAQVPPVQAPPAQAEASPIQAPLVLTSSTQALLPKTLPVQAPPMQATLIQAPPAGAPSIQAPLVLASPTQVSPVQVLSIQASMAQVLPAPASLPASTLQAYTSGVVNHLMNYDSVRKSMHSSYLYENGNDKVYFTDCQYRKGGFERQDLCYHRKKRMKEIEMVRREICIIS